MRHTVARAQQTEEPSRVVSHQSGESNANRDDHQAEADERVMKTMRGIGLLSVSSVI